MAAPVRAAVALGSNLGDRAAHLALARRELGRLPGTVLVAASPEAETPPLGGLDQPAYLNQMVLLDTALGPYALLEACQAVEALAGRRRGGRWASRTLDVDVVRFGDVVSADPVLRLPHPGLADRDFWQRQLVEAAAAAARPPGVDGLPPWAVVGAGRAQHIERVVGLMEQWAAALGLEPAEQGRWRRVAWLHDALRDLGEADLAALAPEASGPAELCHGPACANRLRALGEVDDELVEAVRWHSLGWAGWGALGRALYCADFLEPGRRFEIERRAALAERFPRDPDAVVREVARMRVGHMVASGWRLPDAAVGFWNRLAEGA